MPQGEMHYSHSLHRAELLREPICSEIKDLTRWLQGSMQLDRPGPAVSQRTTDNHLKAVSCYLGFEQLHLKKNTVSLWDFMNLDHYGKYVSYLIAKKNVESTIALYISTARKVLLYLKSNADRSMQLDIIDILKWLSNISAQLASVTAKPRSVAPPLPPAHVVVRKIEELRVMAIRSIGLPGEPVSLEAARLLHDAALSCLMFGYLPPIRLVSIRTLQLPGTIGCHFKGCRIQNCQGNRLLLEDNKLVLLLSHYKVERRLAFYFL